MKGKKIGLIIFIFWAFVILLITSPIVNNITAKKVVADIHNIPLPENTKIIEEVSQAGKLTGNGNGMQFFGAVLVESSLTLEEIEKYYSNYRENDWSYLVEKQTNQKIEAVEHHTISFKSDVRGKNCYIIYSWGEGISPFEYLDLRAN